MLRSLAQASHGIAFWCLVIFSVVDSTFKCVIANNMETISLRFQRFNKDDLGL